MQDGEAGISVPKPKIHRARRPANRGAAQAKWNFPLNDLEPGQVAEYDVEDDELLQRMMRAARSLVTYYHRKPNDDRTFSVMMTDYGFGIWRNT